MFATVENSRDGENAPLRFERKDLQRAWSETGYRIQALRDNPGTAKEEFDGILDDDDPGLDPSTLEQATSEMLGARFSSIESEPLGRHLILISALAK